MADATTADAGSAESRPAPRADATHPITRRSRMLRLRYALFALGAVVLVVGVTYYWLTGGRYVTTDDAYVQADVLSVTTDVSGLVRSIAVHEGELVRKGQVLFRLQQTPFRLAVERAREKLAQTRLVIAAMQADYVRAQRKVAATRALVAADQATFDRYSRLIRAHAVTRQQYDDAKFKLLADQAAVGASAASAHSTLARLGGSATRPISTMPAYKLAEVRLALAERDLRHATVRAPFAGRVTQVSKLQPGQYLAAGTPAFGLVRGKGMWIAAQPKETSLTWARPGQKARITIDAYPGHVWHGVLQSVAPATDQEFAILPAQNSSGNWVKVVQRVPLRVELEQRPGDPPLSAGMSAEVSIDTGHQRHLSDLFR